MGDNHRPRRTKTLPSRIGAAWVRIVATVIAAAACATSHEERMARYSGDTSTDVVRRFAFVMPNDDEKADRLRRTPCGLRSATHQRRNVGRRCSGRSARTRHRRRGRRRPIRRRRSWVAVFSGHEKQIRLSETTIGHRPGRGRQRGPRRPQRQSESHRMGSGWRGRAGRGGGGRRRSPREGTHVR